MSVQVDGSNEEGLARGRTQFAEIRCAEAGTVAVVHACVGGSAGKERERADPESDALLSCMYQWVARSSCTNIASAGLSQVSSPCVFTVVAVCARIA